MSRVTRKQVAELLRELGFGDDIELLQGNGYQYFWGEIPAGWYSSIVYVPRMSDYLLIQWIREAVYLSMIESGPVFPDRDEYEGAVEALGLLAFEGVED